MGLRSVRVLLTTVLVSCALPLLAIQPVHASPGCDAGIRSDFNGDGYSDAVVADPYASFGAFAEVGRVNVLYGAGSDGRVGEGARDVLVQGDRSVGGNSEAGDRFGFAMAAADLNCDNRTDLVVGTPYEDNDDTGQVDSGSVRVIWGAATGLGTGPVSTAYNQVDFGAIVRAGDQFGYSVDALEDVVQNGAVAPHRFTLAIGVPGGDVGGDFDAGWVGTVSPTSSGSDFDVVTQDTAGVPGSTEPYDRFGTSVSLGYFLGAVSIADVAVGSPYDDVGGVADAGTVTIVQDLDGVSGGAVVYDQDSAGVPDVVESDDRFGYSLDSMRSGSTSRLAVGVPYEDIGSAASAGLVQLFSGNGSTLTAGVGLTQNTAGVFEESETGDLFGERVAWARPWVGDTTTWIAVSAPSEDGIANNTGLVQLFPITDLGAERNFSQSSPGIPGDAQTGERFGSALAVVIGVQERALLVGAPDDVENSTGLVDVIPFRGGTPRYWRPGVGGVPGAGASRFGYSLASSG
jgi:FG-GAP repeat